MEEPMEQDEPESQLPDSTSKTIKEEIYTQQYDNIKQEIEEILQQGRHIKQEDAPKVCISHYYIFFFN